MRTGMETSRNCLGLERRRMVSGWTSAYLAAVSRRLSASAKTSLSSLMCGGSRGDLGKKPSGREGYQGWAGCGGLGGGRRTPVGRAAPPVKRHRSGDRCHLRKAGLFELGTAASEFAGLVAVEAGVDLVGGAGAADGLF